MQVQLNDLALNTILAALRCYQQALILNGGQPPQDVADIATDGGNVDPMEVSEIDGLCEQLNSGEPQRGLSPDASLAFAKGLDALEFPAHEARHG